MWKDRNWKSTVDVEKTQQRENIKITHACPQ